MTDPNMLNWCHAIDNEDWAEARRLEDLATSVDEPRTAQDLISAAEAEISGEGQVRIMVDGDMPAQLGYDQALAAERARNALQRVLDEQSPQS